MKILFCALLMLTVSVAYSQPRQFNGGFEKIDRVKGWPEGYQDFGDGYLLSVDSTTVHTGKYALHMAAPVVKGTDALGYVTYEIPADISCKKLTLKGYMKIKDVADGFAGLFLMIEEGRGNVVQHDDMEHRKITGTADWKEYTIELPFPPRTTAIHTGALLTGKGEIWVDDLQLFADGQPLEKAPRAVPLKAKTDTAFAQGSLIKMPPMSEALIRRLVLLGKIWGFLKYYHPAIADGNYNWDFELFRILPDVINNNNKAARNARLSAWIRKLGPVVPADTVVKTDHVKIMPDLDWTTDKQELGDALVNQLQEIRNAKRGTWHYYIGLETYTKNAVFLNEDAYANMQFPDDGYRLLSLYRYWNMIQYYFPYKYLIPEKWDTVLKRFVPEFLHARNAQEYQATALRLISDIHDTHADIYGRSVINTYFGKKYAPLEVRFIEGKLVVARVLLKNTDSLTNIQKGDVIKQIGGKPVDTLVKRLLPYAAASNYPAALRNIAKYLILWGNDSLTAYRYERNGREYITNIPCLDSDSAVRKLKPPVDTCARLLTPEIGYIYPGLIRNAYIPDIMNAFSKTKGIIIDFRCYPKEVIMYTLGRYLVPQATPFVKFTEGSITMPGLFVTGKPSTVGEQNPDYYKGKVVIIINETTQSQSEFTTMVFRCAPKATVIGSTTAGADGNVSTIVLPGDVRTAISGIGVYYPDGRETQRVGILPDITITPTIKGFREGRDELLEKAISVINDQK